MRHRQGETGKIKCKHHPITKLWPLLKAIENWDDVKLIVPGEIRNIKRGGRSRITVQYPVDKGLRCLGFADGCVQEIVVITSEPEKFISRIGSLCDVR